jgi:hypothetical protein
MSAGTVLASVMPMLRSAIDIFESFSGSAAEAKLDDTIQSAADIVAAVVPLIDSLRNGEEITPDDVREALAGMDDALSLFDAEIARQEERNP